MDPLFEDNLAGVRRRIQAACERVGRRPEEVRVLAVSKTRGPDCIREAAAGGLRELRSTVPAATCPAWATCLTGVGPELVKKIFGPVAQW